MDRGAWIPMVVESACVVLLFTPAAHGHRGRSAPASG